MFALASFSAEPGIWGRRASEFTFPGAIPFVSVGIVSVGSVGTGVSKRVGVRSRVVESIALEEYHGSSGGQNNREGLRDFFIASENRCCR